MFLSPGLNPKLSRGPQCYRPEIKPVQSKYSNASINLALRVLLSLSDKQTIEGITVMQRKVVQGMDMIHRHRKQPKIVRALLLLQDTLGGSESVSLPSCALI
jgi:hypothetical protein